MHPEEGLSACRPQGSVLYAPVVEEFAFQGKEGCVKRAKYIAAACQVPAAGMYVHICKCVHICVYT